jgi:hypothetical protein
MKTQNDHPNNVTKKCSSCDNELPITEFYSKGSEGFESRCKKCVLKSKKKYYNRKQERLIKKISRSTFQFDDKNINEVIVPVSVEQ